jgi:heme-degrading monooxygenase HmoA
MQPRDSRRPPEILRLLYVSLSRLRVAPARADELVEAFRSRVHLVDAADGFVDLEVWRSDKEPDELIMVSRWTDRMSFTRYMKSDAHRISHERIPKELQRAITLEQLEHLQTYDVIAT